MVRGVGDDRTHELLTGRSDYALGYLALGSLSTPLAAEGGDTEIDWLGACPATGDCSVTVGIDLSYEHLMGAARAASGYASPEPRAEAFRLQLEATALLEAFDGQTIPVGGVSVSLIRQTEARNASKVAMRWFRCHDPDPKPLAIGSTRRRRGLSCTVLSIGALGGTLQREIVAWEATRAQGPNGIRQRRRHRPSSPSASTSRASAVAAKGRAPRASARISSNGPESVSATVRWGITSSIVPAYGGCSGKAAVQTSIRAENRELGCGSR